MYFRNTRYFYKKNIDRYIPVIFQVSTTTKTESEILFSDRVRFIPSVTVEPDQKIVIPSTPDHKVVSQAAEGKLILIRLVPH